MLATVHPTFLYELLWNVLVAIALVLIDRRFRLGHGRLFALYVALYCFGRFWVELLRADAATEVFGLRINTIVSLVVMLAALVYLWRARRGREEASDLRAPDDVGDDPAEGGPAGDAPPLAGR